MLDVADIRLADGTGRETKDNTKMKKLMIGAAIAGFGMALTGCVFTGPCNAPSPLTLNVSSPEAAFVDNSVKPAKVGEATASGIILFTEGDCSIKAAMENGGIKKIHHIDYKTRNILGIVGSQTTLVYGE